MNSSQSESLPQGFQAEAVLSERPGVRVLRARRGGEQVVLRLEPSTSSDETLAELALYAEVQHAGLARLVDFGEMIIEGASFLWTAREWVEGQDLLAWAQGRDPREIGVVVAQLCPAIGHLHESGFVHGDLKAENVLIAKDGRVFLTDFGLTRSKGSASSGVSGSLFALAPEVLIGGRVMPASDLFALGALLHRLLVEERVSARDFYARFPGRSFFDAAGTSPQELPEWARDLVVRLTSREPARRLGSASAVGAVLATRLGLPASEAGEERLSWPVERGRESWLKELLSKLDAKDDSRWIRLPAGEDPRPLFEKLRLSAVLRGHAGVGLDLEQEVLDVHDGLHLDRWVAERSSGLRGLTFVLAGNTAWIQRAAIALARAVEQRPTTESASPFLVFVSAGERPLELSLPEDEVPPVGASALTGFLSAELRGEDPERIRRFAEVLARAAAGSATRTGELLEEAQSNGWLIQGDGGLELRPGALPSVAGAARSVAGLGESEIRLLDGLSVCGGAVRLQEWMAVSGLADARFVQAFAGLKKGGFVAQERREGGVFVRALAQAPPEAVRLAPLHLARSEWLSVQPGQRSLGMAHAWLSTRSASDLQHLCEELAEDR